LAIVSLSSRNVSLTLSMTIQTYATYEELSRKTADLIIESIKDKPNPLVCLASGHTPIGVFKCLVEDVKAGILDVSNWTFVGLDEWNGMNGSTKGSCRQMMDEDLFEPLNIPAKQIVFFDGTQPNVQAQCDEVNELIHQHGGLDVMLVGIGLNGHIGMNEPGTTFDTFAHISQLAEETISVGQKYFPGETKLSTGITMGLKHFQEARLPIIMANGEKKAGIIAKVAASQPIESLPASIVHMAPQAYVMVDRAAGSLL